MNLKLLSIVGVVALAGCVTAPTGPSREAFPGRGKTFEQFQADDASCRDYASVQTGGKSASDKANEAGVGAAAVGTVVGAAAGALIGGGGRGAAVGAGVGLVGGSAIGSGTAQATYETTQRRYDGSYYQCMYAKGNKVPMYGRYVQNVPARPASTQPPPPPPPPPPATGIAPPANLPLESIPPPDAPPPPR